MTLRQKLATASIVIFIAISIIALFEPNSSRFLVEDLAPKEVARSSNDLTANSNATKSKLQSALAALSELPPGHNSEAILKDLKGDLKSAGGRALKEITSFLDSGKDSATGLPFAIHARGKLDSAPTLRVFILAEMGEIDSVAAARYAKKILEESGSPEELAIALRNYAWGTDNSRNDSYLADRAQKIIADSNLAASPVPAFLETFDLVPYTRSVESIETLLSYTSSERPQELRHAAFIALDKLAQEAPAETAIELQRLGASGEVASAVRVAAMARLDPRVASQIEMLRSYVISTEISSEEHTQFFRVFPLTSRFVGDNLLSEDKVDTSQDMAARDLAARAMLRDWRNDARLAGKNDLIELALKRLDDFLAPLEKAHPTQ